MPGTNIYFIISIKRMLDIDSDEPFIINKKCFWYTNRCLKSIVTGGVNSQAFQVSSSFTLLCLVIFLPFSFVVNRGLKNDHVAETFPLKKEIHENIFPCRFIKIGMYLFYWFHLIYHERLIKFIKSIHVG